MRFNISATSVIACLVGLPAQAEGCFGSGTPLFHCDIGGKRLDVCLQENIAIYRFGPAQGVAEMVLARRAEDMFLLPWNGVGSSIYEEMDFQSGDVTFRVHYTLPRIAENPPELSGGVTVIRADETLADLECAPGSVTNHDFEPLYRAKTDAGQCWRSETFNWQPC